MHTPRIRIQNFGPIRDSGWIDIKKVTLFLGNQGSGKSTVAKLISTFLWMEKALYRGDYSTKQFERKGMFRSQRLEYHRIENYLASQSAIEFKGEIYDFSYSKGDLSISESNSSQGANYRLPQIVYIPAERNFISYIKSSKELKLSSDSFNAFIDDYSVTKSSMNGGVELPINESMLEYDKLNDRMKIKGPGYGPIFLSEAASGFQSVAPLFLVSRHFSQMRESGNDKSGDMSSDERARFKKQIEEIYDNADLTEEQRNVAISVLSKKFKRKAFINIVEEPEQNLFPSSQSALLYELLKFNAPEPNKLIVTTHSPYIVGALSLAMKAAEVKAQITGRADLTDRLNEVVQLDAIVPAQNVAIYEMDEKEGSTAPLSLEYGVPSDENYLNDLLGQLDSDFDKLLDIEDEM